MEDQKVEIITTDTFCMYLNLKSDFKRKYNDLINKPNLLIELSNDIEFMQEFQNEFYKTELISDVYKYWRLIYSKKQILAGIYRINGITNTIEYAPLESELDKRKNECLKLKNKGTLPKECYTHNIEETNIYKQFIAIEDTFNRFKEMKGFDDSADSLRQQAEEFGKGLISEIQNINYKPIRTKVIETIVADKDNIYSYIKSCSNNNKFNKIEFEDNYAKAKMYLDNYLSKYLETKNQHIKTEKLVESTNNKNIVKIKKTPEKWFALLYWFELEVNGEKPPTNHEGAFIRKEIEEIRKKETGKDGQSFYREFKEINIGDEKELNIKFGKDWKTKIIELSNNNEKIKQYLISKYTS